MPFVKTIVKAQMAITENVAFCQNGVVDRLILGEEGSDDKKAPNSRGCSSLCITKVV